MADNVTTQRSKGTVKWFDGRKGFGFITPDDDSEDLFVHQTSIRFEGFRTLFDGQRVEFTVEIGDDGRTRASDVIPMRSHSRPPAGGRGGGGGGGGVDCYNCGRFGHFARDCYHQRGGRGYGGYLGGGGGGRGVNGGDYDVGFQIRRGGGGGRGGNGGDYDGGFQSRRGGGGGGRGYGGGFQSGSGSAYGGGFRGRRGGGGGGGRCYNCGEEGHFARDCQGNQI